MASTDTAPPATGAITAPAGNVIEPATPGDEEENEFEVSDYDASSTASTSVNSSLYQHAFENGRRYHLYRHGRYPIPNDDTEQDRENMKHTMTLELTDGKLFFAPIVPDPQKIIDLGTGTGIWAMGVADAYPSAEVFGLDLSPIQPTWVPSNLKFLVDDIEDEWMAGDNFDLVHLRHMSPILKDAQKVVRAAYDHIKPGGWIEVQEFGGYVLSDDDSIPEGSSLVKFMDLSDEALKKFGMKFRIGNEIGKLLDNAGYVNVECKTIKAPIGKWPRNKTLRLCGMYQEIIMSGFMAVMGAKPFRMLGMGWAEIEVFLAACRNDMKNPAAHHYLNYRFWMGQKPAG